MAHKDSNAKLFVWQRGFQYTIPNGYKLSVAFGPGNYCENKNAPYHEDETGYESSDFEVAVFEPNGDIVDLIPAEGEDRWSDQVIGWVPASALPMLISALKFWPVREEFKNEPETFEKVLRARCRIFRNVCEDYQNKVTEEQKKEAASV